MTEVEAQRIVRREWRKRQALSAGVTLFGAACAIARPTAAPWIFVMMIEFAIFALVNEFRTGKDSR